MQVLLCAAIEYALPSWRNQLCATKAGERQQKDSGVPVGEGCSEGWVQCWEVEGKDNQADRNRNVYLFIFYIFATCLVSGIGDSDADSAAGATSAAVCCQLGCLLYAMYFSKPA